VRKLGFVRVTGSKVLVHARGMETLAEERTGMINARERWIHSAYSPPLAVRSSTKSVPNPVSISIAPSFLPLELLDLLSRFWPRVVRTDSQVRPSPTPSPMQEWRISYIATKLVDRSTKSMSPKYTPS